jgi:hypothetical protein
VSTTVRAAFLGVLDQLSEDESAEVLDYARQLLGANHAPADAPADGVGERARREGEWDDEGGHQ